MRSYFSLILLTVNAITWSLSGSFLNHRFFYGRMFYGSFFFSFSFAVQLIYKVVLFLLYSEVNRPYIYICPLVCRLHSHLGHFRGLSSVLCAIQKVLTSCLHNIYILCLYVNPSLLIYPSLLPYPLVAVSLFSISVTQFLLLQIGSFVLCFLDSMDE